jgi:Fur family peroxide stress response transcriptional regulator
MAVSKSDLAEKIRACGLTPTAQRIAILKDLMSRKDHPSADAVYRTLKDEHPTLSFNTIYMNLMSFAEKGVILKINVLHESARFDGDSSPHHHFVCVRCKKIVDLHNIRMPKITIPKELGAATIFHHQLRLNGICEKCEGKGTVSDRKPRKTQRVSLPV